MWTNVNLYKVKALCRLTKDQGPKSWAQQKPQKFHVYFSPQTLLHVC